MKARKKLYVGIVFAALLCMSSVALASEDTTIAKQVIFDEDGRAVKVIGFDEGGSNPTIEVEVENNTVDAFGLQIRDSSVNGIMTDISASIEVKPGESAVDDFSIRSTELEEYGIEQIADIELSLHFYDPDSYETILDTDPIIIETNLSGSYEQVNDDSGEEIYNDNDVRIVYQGMYENSAWGEEPLLYIENNRDDKITVQLKGTSVNGIMIDPAFYAEIMPGKICIHGIIFSTSGMEEKGINAISEFETSFHIIDNEGTIADSDTVTMAGDADAASVKVADTEVTGDVVYDKNGIRIVSQGLKKDTIWEAELLFYIENNSDKNIVVQMRDTSINGEMVSLSFSKEVMSGKISIDSAVLLSSDAEQVEEIEEMKTSFHIYDRDTHDTIADTKLVEITY